MLHELLIYELRIIPTAMPFMGLRESEKGSEIVGILFLLDILENFQQIIDVCIGIVLTS